MRTSLTLPFATAAALLAAGAAYAQPTEPARPEPRGAMTRADVEQRTAERFGRMDANKDGLLNDADREAARRETFDAIDADKDGAISFAEFDARRDQRGEARTERRDAGERGFGRHGGRGGAGMARAADADKDGTVTQAEFAAAALARFDQADANRDGTISVEERREARQHKRHDRRRDAPARDAG